MISSRTIRNFVTHSSKVPVHAEGSENPAWMLFFAPGKKGQLSRALSQTVTTTSTPLSKNSSVSRDRCPEISMPISFMTATATGFTPRGLCPGTPHGEPVAMPGSQVPLRHLRPGRIVGTDKEHEGFPPLGFALCIVTVPFIFSRNWSGHFHSPLISECLSGQSGNVASSHEPMLSRSVRKPARMRALSC